MCINWIIVRIVKIFISCSSSILQDILCDNSVNRVYEICGVKDNIPHLILNCILGREIWQKTCALVTNLNERDIIFGRPDSAWLNKYFLQCNDTNRNRTLRRSVHATFAVHFAWFGPIHAIGPISLLSKCMGPIGPNQAKYTVEYARTDVLGTSFQSKIER